MLAISAFAFELELLVGEQGVKFSNINLFLLTSGEMPFTRSTLTRNKVALAVFGHAHFTFDHVAGVQVETAHLAGRQVDVVRAGQEAGVERAPKPKPSGNTSSTPSPKTCSPALARFFMIANINSCLRMRATFSISKASAISTNLEMCSAFSSEGAWIGTLDESCIKATRGCCWLQKAYRGQKRWEGGLWCLADSPPNNVALFG